MSGLTFSVSYANGLTDVRGDLHAAVLRCREYLGYDEEEDQILYCLATRDALANGPRTCGHSGSEERVAFGLTDDGKNFEVTFDEYDPTDQWSVIVAGISG